MRRTDQIINTIKNKRPVIVIYARDGRRRRTVERRTRGLRPSHTLLRFSKGAMNHGRLEGKTSEGRRRKDDEREEMIPARIYDSRRE